MSNHPPHTTNEDNESTTNTDYISSLWLRLVKNLTKYNANDLRKASVCEMFPAEDCEDLENPNWRRIVLRKRTKNTWELLDESGTELLEQVKATTDVGPIAEWDMYYRRPLQSSITEARNKYNIKYGKGLDDNNELLETPTRKRIRDEAHAHQLTQARGMKKRAKQVEVA